MVTSTHSHAVQLIRGSGDAICLKIITPARRCLDRVVRQPERVAVSCQQELRLSAANSGPSRDRLQRKVNKASSRINVLPSQSEVGCLPSGKQLPPARLPTARSMPDLTAAVDNHSAPEHTHQNNHNTGQTHERVQTSSDGDYRDRVLYELTNQLHPSPHVVTQPSLDVASTAQRIDDDQTSSENRPHTQSSADQSTNNHQRPAPPPRVTSLSSRLYTSTSAVSLLTASRAKSTGSEFKELLGVSGHDGTTSRTAEQSFTSSPSTEERSTISGEHLVLPSQLKKLQRSPADDQGSKQNKSDGTETSTPVSSHEDATIVNGHSSVGTCQVVIEQRSPLPKRPAPPPPSSTTALPATNGLNGEVNFLVMAEKARKQYILSKLARETLAARNAAGKSTGCPANYHHGSQANDDHGLQKAVNGSADSTSTTDGGSHTAANGNNVEHQQTSNIPTSSPQTDVKGRTRACHTVQQTDISSSPPPLVGSACPPRDSTDTWSTGPAPAIPPKRRHRNNARVELCNDETCNVERRLTANINENGTQPQLSTSEVSGEKLAENCAVNTTHNTPHQQDGNQHGRRSNAKLIRGKNVIIRRSGASRLLADDNLVINNKPSTTNGHKSCQDAGQIQQLSSMSDVLPPPPEFAD